MIQPWPSIMTVDCVVCLHATFQLKVQPLLLTVALAYILGYLHFSTCQGVSQFLQRADLSSLLLC